MIHGAQQMLRRDQPLVATELNVHLSPRYSVELLEQMASLGYVSFLVEEVCGVQMDCRNLVHVPRPLLPSFTRSPAFNLALGSGVVFEVDGNTILQTAFPCCVAGGECCPRGSASPRCCGERVVGDWVRERLTNASRDGTPGLARDLGRGAGVLLRQTPMFFAVSGATNQRWRELQRLAHAASRPRPRRRLARVENNGA